MRPSVVPAVSMEFSKELSSSGATVGEIHGQQRSNFTESAWRCCKGFVTMCLLIILLLKIISAQTEESWTKLCTGNCRCSWVGWKETADCQGAGFHNIPSGLSPELQELDLSFNWIPQISEHEFEKVGLGKLRKVSLRSSKIAKIDRDAFCNLKIMVELDLTGNELESLHLAAFESNERLEELRLSGNPLTKLHGSQFPPLVHLKLLDLSNCKLSRLNKNIFEKLSTLEQLDLKGNKFQYISEQVLTSLVSLKSLSLEKNPWKCDCHLRSFRDWIVAQKFYQPLTCTEPGRLENVQWSILQSIDFACKPEIASVRIGGQATQALIVNEDVGSDITLECTVQADPAPKVKWVRDGRVLANSSFNHGQAYLLHISSGEYVRSVHLKILKSDRDDAGEYFCVGNNAGGVVEKKLTLNIQNFAPAIQTGVGGGYLDGKYGACHDQFFWLWILVGVLGFFGIIILVVTAVCLCTFKGRGEATRPHDLKLL